MTTHMNHPTYAQIVDRNGRKCLQFPGRNPEFLLGTNKCQIGFHDDYVPQPPPRLRECAAGCPVTEEARAFFELRWAEQIAFGFNTVTKLWQIGSRERSYIFDIMGEEGMEYIRSESGAAAYMVTEFTFEDVSLGRGGPGYIEVEGAERKVKSYARYVRDLAQDAPHCLGAHYHSESDHGTTDFGKKAQWGMVTNVDGMEGGFDTKVYEELQPGVRAANDVVKALDLPAEGQSDAS